MVDTSQGVRFSRKPGYLRPTNSLHVKGGVLEIQTNGNDQQPQPVVRQEDKDLVTEYLFLLMAQMQTCCFTESDRTGGRSKIKDNQVGFPGMECRHCQGRAGFGRYFPNTVSAFSLANSDRVLSEENGIITEGKDKDDVILVEEVVGSWIRTP